MNAEQKIKYLPAGGIAGFVMSEEDIEKLEAEELTEQYGTTGIAQFSTIGKNMANFGRHGDDTVAHVETGELIVPRALIENNPKLKESIFNHLRELGVEDPERYVVGESKNSLNPTTGLPEFFFKKLFRSVSKVVKSVGKVLKKAAPIIVPIALNFIAPGLGAVYSGAIGSGIATLIQGGSIKDAFKSALIGGATGALTAGFAGPGEGLSGFGDNIAADVSMGTQNISDAFSQGSFAPLQNTNIPSIRNYDANPANNTGTEAFNPDGTRKIINLDNASVTNGSENFGVNKRQVSTITKAKTDGDVLKDFNLDAPVPRMGPVESFQKGNYLDAGTGGANVSVAEVAKANNIDIRTLKTTDAVYKELVKKAAELSPNAIAKYGPSVALATAAGAAGGMFDTPESDEDELEEMETGMTAYNENPGIYGVRDLDLRYIESDPRVASKYPYYRPRNVQAAAQGGQIFPRRVGGIMPNEGIPNQDSVRAMLMPGEFVMTTDAVKGLGGGNMNKGINNMYGVMRNLEQRGRRA